MIKKTYPSIFTYYDEGAAPLYEPCPTGSYPGPNCRCHTVNHTPCNYTMVPPAMDFVSTDNYNSLSSGVANPRSGYNHYLLPRMSPHQLAWVIPPATNFSDSHWACSGTTNSSTVALLDKCLLAETKRYFRWIEEEERIVGAESYHWGTYNAHDIGLTDLPTTQACYAQLAAQMLAHAENETSAQTAGASGSSLGRSQQACYPKQGYDRPGHDLLPNSQVLMVDSLFDCCTNCTEFKGPPYCRFWSKTTSSDNPGGTV